MTGVPSNIIIPWVGVDFDATKAEPASADFPVQALLIGQRLSTGAVAANTKYIATTADQVARDSGFGSQLHEMAKKYFKNSTTIRTTCIGLDDGAGTTATHAFTVAGTATGTGEFITYVSGQRYAVAVVEGDTETQVADAVVAALTEDVNNLPCTAANVAGLITLTMKNAGVAAGDLDVRFNYNSGELFPPGISAGTITTVAGTVDPDINDALGAIGDDWFVVIAQPYTDNTNMNAIEDFLLTQNGPMYQKGSLCYQALRDTRTNLITFGEDVANRNSEFMNAFPATSRMESTVQVAAGVAGAVAQSLVNDGVHIPLHRMKLVGFDVVDSNDTWDPIERNQLAQASISTLSDDNGVQTEAMVTMYRENSAGAKSTAYQQQNTMYQLFKARYSFVNWILTRYPRASMATSSEGVEGDFQIMTEDIAETEAVAWFQQEQEDGNFEPGSAVLEQFKSELKVQRSSSNNNRMEWLLPPDLMNQFIVGSGTIQFLG
jgi:phage tail sheath gpL-like